MRVRLPVPPRTDSRRAGSTRRGLAPLHDRTASAILLRAQRTIGNRATTVLVRPLLQRVSSKTRYRVGDHTFTALELVQLEHEVTQQHWLPLVAAAPTAPAVAGGLRRFQVTPGNWLAVWKGIGAIMPDKPGDQARQDHVEVTVAGKTVTIDKGFWVKVPGARIKYQELAADLAQEQTQLAGQLAGGGAPGQEQLQQAMSTQIGRIRSVVEGQTPANVSPTEIALACVWFGAETVRNPRSWAAGWQLLDLMDRRRTYGRTAKPYTWLNVITAQLHPDEQPGDKDLAPESWRLRKGALDTSPGERQARAQAIVGGQSAQLKKGMSGYWGGKHPMAHTESEKQGKIEPGSYRAEHEGKLNIVQAKEAALLIHWLEGKQVDVKADRAEQRQVIRSLLAGRVGATTLQL